MIVLYILFFCVLLIYISRNEIATKYRSIYNAVLDDNSDRECERIKMEMVYAFPVFGQLIFIHDYIVLISKS